MSIRSGETDKAYWQKQIDIRQARINLLKSENVRLRETMKYNNSRTGSKSSGEHCKRKISSNNEEIKKLQNSIKILKDQKSRTPKNQKTH